MPAVTAFLQPANNAESTLALSVGAADVTMVLIDGSPLPVPGNGYHVAVGGSEIVKVTARSGNSLTVLRARQGTTAVAHASGASVQQRIDKEWMTAIHGAVNAIETESIATAATLAGLAAADGVLGAATDAVEADIVDIQAGGSAGIWRRMTPTMGDGTPGPYPLGFNVILGALCVVTLDGLGGLIPVTHYTITGDDIGGWFITFVSSIDTDVQIDVWQ